MSNDADDELLKSVRDDAINDYVDKLIDDHQTDHEDILPPVAYSEVIKTRHGEIEVVLDKDGEGTIVQELRRITCDQCDSAACVFDCYYSENDLILKADRDDVLSRVQYNAAQKGVEQLLLSLIMHGFDVQHPDFITSIEEALDELEYEFNV